MQNTEDAELEATHQDHRVQFLALYRTPQESHLCLRVLSKLTVYCLQRNTTEMGERSVLRRMLDEPSRRIYNEIGQTLCKLCFFSGKKP